VESAAVHFPHLGGFESTKIHGSGTDILETTGHLERWREDLDMLRAAGIDNLRYSAPWHRIESSPGNFDFSWMDKPMAHMREQGMKPVIDLVHHTSFPDWLENGFASPELPELLSRFAECFASRYEWVDSYTVFNEPLATTLLCSFTGAWYPHHCTDRTFVRMGHNVARAIAAATSALRQIRPDFTYVYVDTCERHTALDAESQAQADYANHRRFWVLDLIQGGIAAGHPFVPYLTDNGITLDDLLRFSDRPVRVDILGLDYYAHSEMEWCWNRYCSRAAIRLPHSCPVGFAHVAAEYRERYGLPLMLTETNLRGYVTDRITWLRFMHEQCESLVCAGADFRGFCWYPSIDSTDWGNLCTRPTKAVDPQGIWYLDDSRTTRHTSELSKWYSKLASGAATSRDLPAYNFRPPLDRQLSGYAKLMSHWNNWQLPKEARKGAS